MAEHKAIYKCRLCGKTFEDCTAGEELAQMMTLALATVGTTKYVKCNGDLHMHSIHYCEDGSFGLADFQGFKKVGE